MDDRSGECFGVVVLLDALGVRSTDLDAAKRFLLQRGLFEGAWSRKLDQMTGALEPERLKSFTFGDTLLFAYSAHDDQDAVNAARDILVVLRKTLADSLDGGLLVRGSIAIGKYIVDNDSNTVVGPAVTEAAEWYEAFDWIGVCMTPRSSFLYRARVNGGTSGWAKPGIDYECPLKQRAGLSGIKSLSLIACNWPSTFFFKALAPHDLKPDGAGQWIQRKLVEQRVMPLGTEQKYFNTLAFFHHVQRLWEKDASVSTAATQKRRAKSGRRRAGK